MAIESGYPIAIQTLVRVEHIAGLANGLDYSPGKVKVVWSKPISVEGLTSDDVKGLSEKVATVMMEELNTNNPAIG